MEGTVIKSTGSWLTVLDNNNDTYNCKLKGKFRMKGIKTTNPVAVGDNVLFNLEKESKTGTIHQIKTRQNYIIRKATKLSKVSSNSTGGIFVLIMTYFSSSKYDMVTL